MTTYKRNDIEWDGDQPIEPTNITANGEAEYEFIESTIKYIKPGELTEGQELKGTYLESFIDNFGKDAYKFRDNNNNIFVLNGAGNLSHILSSVVAGENIALRYNGKIPLPKTHKYAGTPAHSFTLGKKKG